jgi:hypothetical protein
LATREHAARLLRLRGIGEERRSGEGGEEEGQGERSGHRLAS